MKILMLNYEYPPLGGGAAPVTKQLSEELVRIGHTVDVVTMGFNDLPQKESINGVNIYRVPCIRKKREMCTTHEMLSYCISATRLAKELMKTKKYDLNHTHFIIPTGIVSYLNRKRIPYIVTLHGSDVPGYNPDRFAYQHMLAKPFWKKIIKNSSCMTSPTSHLKDLMLSEYSEAKKVEIIPNGINPGQFTPKEKDNKILVVTRLFERKGVQYVIEAMKHIDGYKLTICGNGPYRKTLEKQISELGLTDRVNLLGYVNDEKLKEEYETSAIFVLPSSSENFPVVLLEAMASGCSIVTTNVTGCPEVVGDSALLVRPKSSEDIAQALTTLTQNYILRRELGIRARIRVENDYSWDKIAENYVRIYESVISSSKN